MAIAFLLQAVCLVLVLTVGRLSGTLFTVTLVLTFFTWGEVFSLFPSIVGDYYRHAARHIELRRAVLGQGRGVDHRRRSRRAVVRAVRQLVGRFYGSAALALAASVIAFTMRVSASPSTAPLGVPATAK